MELGTRVTAPKQLRRHRVYVRGAADKKEWYTPDWDRHHPVNGIYVGYRNYANGTVQWEEDSGLIFTPTDYIKIALIVTNERAKPIPVLFSEMSVNCDSPTEK